MRLRKRLYSCILPLKLGTTGADSTASCKLESEIWVFWHRCRLLGAIRSEVLSQVMAAPPLPLRLTPDPRFRTVWCNSRMPSDWLPEMVEPETSMLEFMSPSTPGPPFCTIWLGPESNSCEFPSMRMPARTGREPVPLL